MFGDVDIVCDKCEYVGCTVKEIYPPADCVGMKEYADRRHSIMQRMQSHYELKDRKWIITCPECNHTHTWIEYAKPRFIPNFGDAGSHKTSPLKIVS